MRELVCPICGGTRARQLYRETLAGEPGARREAPILNPEGVRYRINRCAGCSLVYSSPILDEAEVAALYIRSPHTNVREGEEDHVRRTFEGYYRLLRPRLGRRDRMLDIGCDVGILLAIARHDGFGEVFGVEPNPLAAKQAARIPDSRISGEFYEVTRYPAEHFDLVTMIHVVDHLVDVNRFLARVLRDLRPGGLALAVVHNVSSLLARVLGQRFPPFNIYHHYFFSPRTLRLLFERAGFEVVHVGPTWNRYSLGFLATRTPVISGQLRSAVEWGLSGSGLGRLAVTLPLGNVGIVARKPGSPS